MHYRPQGACGFDWRDRMTERQAKPLSKLRSRTARGRFLRFTQLRRVTWSFGAGEGEMVVEDEVRRVRAGDSVPVAPSQRYGCRAKTELRVVEVQ